MNNTKRISGALKKIKRVPAAVFLAAAAVLCLLPIVIILTNSFMSQGEINRNFSPVYTLFDHAQLRNTHYAEFRIIPDRVTPEQYRTLLFQTPVYLDLFINSVRLTAPIVVLQTVMGSLAAYGFTVWRHRLKNILFYVYVTVMIMPYQATLVSNYIIAGKLGILGGHMSIILPWGFSPFAVFIMYQSMKGIHRDILNAAMLDGAGHIRRFLHMALPLSKGGAASLAILCFVDCWGMVEQPMVFLSDMAKAPLSLMLAEIGREGTGLIFAASVFYMLPAVWVFLYGIEYFEQGIKLSAIK